MRSNQSGQATFDQVPIGIAHTRIDGRFLLVNRKLCELLGYSAAELEATDLISVTHEDDVAHDLHERQRLISGRIERFTRETRYRRKDGRLILTNLTLSLHRDTVDGPYFIAIIEDLTERKYIEAQLHKAQQADMFERLTVRIAHDLDNALAIIDGYAELALEQLGERGGAARRDIESIRAAGKRAAALIGHLLD